MSNTEKEIYVTENEFQIDSSKINLTKTSKGSKCLQFTAAIAANLCVMAAGSLMAWSSPVLLMLQNETVSEENPLGRPITTEETSWIGSILLLGSIAGNLFTGYLSDRLGRRTTLLCSIIPSAVSWVLIFTGKSIEFLYAARFIGGLAAAIPFGVIPVYCGEIAETSIRGILGSFFQLFITLGLLWAYSIGPFISYTNYCIACAVLPIAFFISFYPMPESPYYLAAKSRKEDVIKVLIRLRGKKRAEVETEANEIEVSVQEAYSKQATILDLFKVKANLKALIATCALIFFQQMSGITVVLLYSELIFSSAGEFGLSSSVQTIIVGLVQFLGSCVNPLAVDRLGRKILLIISSSGAGLSLGILGLFFYLKDAAGTQVSHVGWLPVFSLVTYMATYGIGLGPLPWTIMGEMFSQEVKSKASTIVVFTNAFLAFIVSKYFIGFAVTYGQYTAFWFSGIICILCILFTVFYLPETKGRSLQEIQNNLNGKNNL
ncbi:Similar to Tret1-2: Facilitated trehalose transporter Tret1-2 homolog (Drosophila simulans) [Cotesia congregata]|uniref:Similar to Tret1-2: Facilitated trehalose transporter Tret1-2 homolog (Drosophila simulans) n=1 Tax=Cotesia congregata TaxID=51543 RepID=A0A8J2H5K5_COTCN|nr:Similar to Tret1-2: Facilitated trehalose transporter Tret1-2 homolog (Drosophila simulans) [Cotesia congregata]